ncbi:hypothetical protein F5Y01DRAFT_280446 [Xylaria sp. FL0043]|nr:hypothetical protein F5Y01DRAFT_280446 [Xylaria sp. FL0043]
MSPSTETIVNVVFGIVACLIAIGGIIATLRAGRNQRYHQSHSGGAYNITLALISIILGRYLRNYSLM